MREIRVKVHSRPHYVPINTSSGLARPDARLYAKEKVRGIGLFFFVGDSLQ